jgi:hypothetical protein
VIDPIDGGISRCENIIGIIGLNTVDDDSITGANFEQIIAIVGFPLHVQSSHDSL